MYYIWHDNASETKARIIEMALEGYQGNKSEEEMEKSIKMPDYPKAPFREGMVAIEYINPKTKEYIYEYEPAPLTQEQEIEKIKKELELAQQAIDELLLAKSE